MTNLSTNAARLTLPCALALLVACDNVDQLCDANGCFSIEEFGDNIAASLEGQTVGWSYAIYYNGKAEKFDAGGYCRTSGDAPQVAQSVSTPSNMGSVSKTFTTVGVLQLIGVGAIETPIADWLPSDWTLGPNVDAIRFSELLTHTSGFRGTHDSYDAMKAAVAAGIDTNDKSKGEYSNLNFTLFRVIIPYLDSYDPNAHNDQAQGTADHYIAYMQEKVFAPAGVLNVDAAQPEHNPCLYYAHPAVGLGGWDFGSEVDEHLITGAGTWHLSTSQLAAFGHSLAMTDDLLHPANRNYMLEFELGIYKAQLTGGTAYWHNGFMSKTAPPFSEVEPAGFFTVLYLMPNDVQVGVHYNSKVGGELFGGTINDIRMVVENAYEDAWTTVP